MTPAPSPRIGDGRAELSSFQLDPERSAVLIDVRSTVGPLSFGTLGVTGTIHAAFADGLLRTDIPPSGRLTIDVAGLNSGNRLYDAELLRRIDARGFPAAFVELRECAVSGPGPRYRLAGELTFHGVTRLAEGTVTVDAHLRSAPGDHGGAGLRHPGLRHPVAHHAHVAHLPRRAGAPSRRGRATVRWA